MRVRGSFAPAVAFAIVWLTASSASVVSAQQAITSASLGGHVRDATAGILPGAVLTLLNTDTNQQYEQVTDVSGRYAFLFVPPGTYLLTTSVPGFASATRRLTISLGQALDVPVVLGVANLAQAVEVTADIPVVETVRTQMAETVTPREVQSLPLNGRNYLDLALLAPGVSRTNTGASQRFAETSAVPGTGISVSSQRNLNNTFIVDGLSANDDAAGLAGTFFSQEVIREFQIVSSGGIAEFGRASGGIISVVTQSGTNAYRGGSYGFFRNDRFDSRNALAVQKDPLSQQQYGATFGGPLVRNQTFFFANVERTQNSRTGIITVTNANVAAINGVLDTAGFAGPRTETGQFPTGYDTSNAFVRVDHRVGLSSMAARYSVYDVASNNARGVGGLGTVSRGSRLDNTDHTGALSLLTSLGSNAVNELRTQFTRSALDAGVNDLVGPSVSISGVANFGTSTSSPTARDTTSFEIADSLTLQRGNHLAKVGVDLLYNRTTIEFPGALQGVYAFSSLANFRTGTYTTYQQAFGRTSQFQSNPNFGVFAQDHWRMGEGWTLNAGVRYDVQLLPDPIRTDSNNVSPRVGVAYAPGDRKTVVRASAGLFYDRLPLRAVSNALQRDGTTYKVAVIAFNQAGAPRFPAVLPAFPADLLVSITTIDPEIENSFSRQVSLQVERDLLGKGSIAVGYQRLEGRKLIMSRNINAPTLSAADANRLGIANLGRPDSRFANVSRYEDIGVSDFNGLTLSVNLRPASWSSVRLSYGLSEAFDNSGNFFFSQPQDAKDPMADYGPSDNDQRHRVTLSGAFEMPRTFTGIARAAAGLQLSYIYSYGSKLPFNVQTGADRNNDTNNNDRPVGVGRNSMRGFDYSGLDFRLARRFTLGRNYTVEGLVEVFNVLNRANYQVPNNVIGTGATPLATFGQPTAALDPRQAQFGVKIGF